MSMFAGIAVLFVVLFLIQRRLSKRGIPQPTFIPERVPFLTHAIGTARYGASYYKSISERTGLPIFALRLLSQTIYIVTDVSLISKVQRHPTISFDPFVLLAAERLCGASKSMLDTMRKETKDGKKTRSSLMNESHVLTHSMFRSQPNLVSMVGKILDVVSNELDHANSGDLFEWIRHTVCLASTDAVYGPSNPFRVDPQLENAFWDYDADLSMLLLNFLPSITARKGNRAKKALRQAFTNYFRSGGAEHASEFVRASNDANVRRGVSEEDRAGFEVVHCIGLLVNTPPTLFWMLYHVYSKPMLLEQLRTELTTSLGSMSEDDCSQRLLDIEKLMKSSPLFQSTFKEVLRVHASSLSTRIVLEDTSIGNDILLKKGGIVHMPSKCLHSDTKHFGPNANTFDPSRFLNETPSKSQTAFRPFGGGSTLCPGRHFATMQILSITALIILSYDIVPKDGKWLCPNSLQSTMTTTVLPPVDAVHVQFRPRQDATGNSLRLKA